MTFNPIEVLFMGLVGGWAVTFLYYKLYRGV